MSRYNIFNLVVGNGFTKVYTPNSRYALVSNAQNTGKINTNSAPKVGWIGIHLSEPMSIAFSRVIACKTRDQEKPRSNPLTQRYITMNLPIQCPFYN